MGLKLNQTVNTINYEYWVAQPMNDKTNDKTNILMLLYTNKDAKSQGQKPVRENFLWQMDGCYKTGEEVYDFVKQSREENEVELNKFVNAENV